MMTNVRPIHPVSVGSFYMNKEFGMFHVRSNPRGGPLYVIFDSFGQAQRATYRRLMDCTEISAGIFNAEYVKNTKHATIKRNGKVYCNNSYIY